MLGERHTAVRSGILITVGVLSIAGLVIAGLAERPVRAEVPAQVLPATPEPLAIGSAGPDFSLPGTDGKTYSLASSTDSKALAELAAFAKEPVSLEKVTVAEMKALAANTTGKTLLVNFWATWCAPCVEEFPDLMDTWRMYRRRPFQLVTVTINYPDEETAVRAFLESQKASARNLIPAAADPAETVLALDKDWNGGVPYSMVIAPGGKVLYRGGGRVDILKVRRIILGSFPER